MGAGVVNMYAPWCSHCIKAAPEYKAAAERMDGEVEFGALNCAHTRQLALKPRFPCSAFAPTVVWMKPLAPETQFPCLPCVRLCGGSSYS